MSEQAGKQQQTVEDALAQRVEARRGTGSPWAEALRELGAVDRAVYQAVARTPTPALDRPFRRLSNAANYSRLWLGIAAAIALAGGKRGQHAALEGVLSIGVTSAAVNLGLKPLARRRRPDRADPAPPGARQVRMPESGSFPSGHAASAFAFAYAVGRHLPGLAVPIRLLAAGVGYSRVHTGVHYPGDVVIGSVLGAGTAAMTAAACDRFLSRPDRHGVLFRYFAGTDLAGRVRAGLALRCRPLGITGRRVRPQAARRAGPGLEGDDGMPEYAVAITFPQNSTAYEALSKLSAAPGGFEIRSAAIVERDNDGHLHVPEGGDAMAGVGTVGGSLIGMLIGVLGGPVGMLLGWSAGAASGALYDADRLDTGDEAIEQFGALVPTGGNALLAETAEDTTEPLDTFVSELGGSIVRRPLDEVIAELEAQQAAAEEAEKAARNAIREQKKQERKETRQQRVDALKAKFRKQ